MPAELLEIVVDGVGVPTIFEQDKRLPLVSMQLIFRDSGSLSEIKSGLAKLSSNLLNEGTKEMGSVEFSTQLDSRAVSLHASAGAETFVISLSSLKSEWSFALTMLKKLIDDPNYTDEAFEKVVAQSVGSLTQKQSDFDFVASNGLKSLLFEGTAREHPFSGTVESIKSITLEDTKKHILEHLSKENLIVVAGGDVNTNEIKNMVSDIVKLFDIVTVPAIKYTSSRKKPKEQYLEAKTEQAYIYFGAPYHVSYDSDDAYLGKVASFVLGSSGFGSRLMEEIRVKRGLAYSAYANLSSTRTSSYFSGHLQTKLDNANQAKLVVGELLDIFVQKGITHEELQSAKQFLLGSEPLRTETLQQRLGRAFNEYYAGKKLGYNSIELEKISLIDLDQINNFIHQREEIAKLSFYIVSDSMTK
ncbi:MAG: insulinase family protein [Sulfurovum sp.]|nr:insulinase family protein [Sulfurovum sp.]